MTVLLLKTSAVILVLRESSRIDTEILGFISGRSGGRRSVTGFEALDRGARVRFGNIEGVGVLECGTRD